MNDDEKQPTTEGATTGSPTAPGAPVETTDAGPLTPAQIEELQAKAAQAEEHWDRLLRQTADFDNFRKRAARDRQDAIRYAAESVVTKLVPVMDNFDAALTAANTAPGGASDSLRVGINMIYSQLKSVLAEVGLEEMDVTGQTFDPNLHEAVSHQESADVPEGQVLQQLRKGYRLKERLVRPATVIVAKKPGAGESAQASETSVSQP